MIALANRDAPQGMRALKNANGSHPPVKQFAASTSVIFEGQMVIVGTDGLAAGAPAQASMATTAGRVLGVAAAYKALATTAGAKKVQVFVDPDQLYMAQADDATLDSRTDYLGRNFKLTAPNSGNTTTLQSIAEIDASTGTSVSLVGTTAVPIQIVDVWPEVGNVVNAVGTQSSNAKFVVRILPRYHLYAGSKGL
jgi:Fe-S cluster assembly iron-binding protein IscA